MRKRNLLVGVVAVELLCALAYAGLIEPMRGQELQPGNFNVGTVPADNKHLLAQEDINPSVVDERHYTTGKPERHQRTAPALTLDKVELSPTGVLKEGDTLTIRVSGSPYCMCTFTIDGIAADQPMDVNSPGKYTGNYLVTERDTKVNARATVTIRGTNGETATKTSETAVTIDGSAPTATNFAPPPNSEIHNKLPLITAIFDDGAGTGVDDKSVRLWVNGKDVTKSTEVKGGTIKYQPEKAFKDKDVKVHLLVADKAKNVTDYNWSFSFVK